MCISKRAAATTFILLWLLSLVLAFFFLPIPPGLLLLLQGHVSSEHVKAIYCVALLLLFSIVMYASDLYLKLGGLLTVLPSKSRLAEALDWPSFYSSKITTLSIFAATMGTMLTLVVTFLTGSGYQTYKGLAMVSGFFLIVGLIFVLVGLEAYDTLSGRSWNFDERTKLAARALTYYILSWYSLVASLLLLTSFLSHWLTFFGSISYVVCVGRYYFFLNLDNNSI